MAFWNLSQSDDSLAAIDAATGREWSYADLRRDTERIAAALPRVGRKTLGLVLAQNRYECLVAYIAALRTGSAVILLDATLNPELLQNFLADYPPDWIFTALPGAKFAGYRQGPSEEAGLLEREHSQDIVIHPDLALLLSTSGSTGSPKLVRLTLGNLEANAASIAEYLELTSADRPITSLPMPYSYGLSVINSHLHAGATIVFTEDGVLRREFWETVDQYGCTSFAGVPYTYQLLLQAGLLNKKGASLKTLTQAGGRLEEHYVQQMLRVASSRGWKFFVMYGQTEATARISYVPFGQLGGKVGSIGVAVPGGSLSIDEATEELVYAGPNVMMGYAQCVNDLAKGDELHGVLRTGDQARCDADGYFQITGRLKRFHKMFGKRFNLDDVEKVLSKRFGSTVACSGRDDLLMASIENCSDTAKAREAICQLFHLPRTAVKVIPVSEMPLTANGKLDYRRLAEPADSMAQIQIVSSFTSTPIEPSLSRVLLCGDVAQKVDFTNYSAIAEYVLGQSSTASNILGTLILLRVEDWLRPELKASGSNSVDTTWARQRLLVGVEEIVSLLTRLASRGKPVWFVTCPSSGWIVGKHEQLNALCRPYTSLLDARIGRIPGITLVKWPGNLLRGEIEDNGADRLGQIPYTRPAFNQLGEILGAQITRTFVQKAPATRSDGTTSPELAAYLAGLQVQVRLTPASLGGHTHVDRLLRIPATFTLTGEKNDIADTEVDAVIMSGNCILVDVSDRLSHYGPSGVIHFVADGDAMAVKSMALSCAVLGKQVEYAVVSALADLAVERGFAKLIFEYTPAGRNQPTRSFLQSIAVQESDTLYVLPVRSAKTRLRAAAAAAGTSTPTWQDDSTERVAQHV